MATPNFISNPNILGVLKRAQSSRNLQKIYTAKRGKIWFWKTDYRKFTGNRLFNVRKGNFFTNFTISRFLIKFFFPAKYLHDLTHYFTVTSETFKISNCGSLVISVTSEKYVYAYDPNKSKKKLKIFLNINI